MENNDNSLKEYFKGKGHSFHYTLDKSTGKNCLLVLLDRTFRSESESHKEWLQNYFQTCIRQPHVDGKVIIVWEDNQDRVGYLDPHDPPLNRLLSSLTLDFFARIDGEISYP
jgi:hypothetical protein